MGIHLLGTKTPEQQAQEQAMDIAVGMEWQLYCRLVENEYSRARSAMKAGDDKPKVNLVLPMKVANAAFHVFMQSHYAPPPEISAADRAKAEALRKEEEAKLDPAKSPIVTE